MFQHSLHLSEPRIPPKEPYNHEIRNKNTSRVEWRKVNQRKYRRNLKIKLNCSIHNGTTILSYFGWLRYPYFSS